ncbi:MAG: alpha/beta hydrolase-fold protein [Chitinophagales bacterium]
MSEQHEVRVELFDASFYIPQLDRSRRIWVCLPEDYSASERKYPVIYMHDGQNLFDNATAAGQEWSLDETLADIHGQCIIIGIDNGEEKRSTEYNFRDSEEFGAGEGRKYIEFIALTLKPVVDERLRTLPDREHTFIAGSSLGGLISFYGAIYFADTFGGAGIFSPSFWLVPDIVAEIRPVIEKNAGYQQHFYFYGARQEDEKLLSFIEEIAAFLAQYPQYRVFLDLHEEGEHSEGYWGLRFADYYRWLEINWNSIYLKDIDLKDIQPTEKKLPETI